jgi:FKBP-type peptidyl-prolyl cis-trans isomerase (trigger factor)
MKFHKLWGYLLAATLLVTSLAACSDGSSSDGDDSDTTSSDTTTSSYDYSAGLTEDGFFENVKASDYVTLPTYKGVTVYESVLKASDADLQDQLDSILSKYTTYEQIKDRAVVDGDTLNIDYVGKVDGVEFDGGNTNGAGTDVTIGTTQYIDDFLEQLIGHKPGETFDIQVTFPDPYESNTDLSGKDAVFTVTINYIQGDAIAAELTDTIAADYGFTTKDELIADIQTWLISQQKLKFFDDLVANVECTEIPAAVLDYVKNEDIAYYTSYAESYSMDVDSFMYSYMGYESLDAYVEAQADTYKSTATKYIIVQAIAEAEGLSATDADITAAGYDDYVATYGSAYLKLYLLENKIVPNFIVDNGVVTQDTTAPDTTAADTTAVG